MIILARTMMIIRNCYRVFVTNIRSILLYAIVGTILNFLIIGGCLVLKEVEPFLDNFGLKLHMCIFQFCWPTAIVQMETNETTNVTTSQVETTRKIRSVTLNLVTTSQVQITQQNQIGDFKLIFRFSFLQVSSLQLILWQCSPFLERSLSFLPFLCVWVWAVCFAASLLFDLVINSPLLCFPSK